MMTREQIESAIASGNPFELRMADGRAYRIPHRDFISLPPAVLSVVVYDATGHYTILPLLTMTALESKIESNGS
jgi:hypothetical protein